MAIRPHISPFHQKNRKAIAKRIATLLRTRSAPTAATVLAVSLTLPVPLPAIAQIAAPAGGISPSSLGSPAVGIPGDSASGSNLSGTSAPGAPLKALTLTMADVVNISLGNNTSVIQAQQRLQQAREQIVQVNAQNRPQIRVDASDTYNSYNSTANALGPTVQNPVLPSGATIPTITDAAASQASSLSAMSSPLSGAIVPGISTGTGSGNFGIPGGGAGNPGAGAGGSTPSTAIGGGATPGVPVGISPAAGGNSVNGGAGTSANPGAAPAISSPGISAPLGPGGTNPIGGPAGPNGANGNSGNAGGGSNTTDGDNVAQGGAAPAMPMLGGGSAMPSTNAPANGFGTDNGAQGGNGDTGTGANGGTGLSTPNSGAGGVNGGNGSSMAPPPAYPPPSQAAMMPSVSDSHIQVAEMPSILQDFLTASDGGGVVIAQDGQEKQVGQPVASSKFESAKANAATSGATSNATSPVTSATPATSYAYRNAYGARITGSQYIDLFGYVPAAREAEKAISDFYVLDLERTRNETSLTAKSTFFNVLLAQDQVALEQEQVNYATENVRITTARRQQGIAADYDVLTAQTALANSQQLFITAQDQLQLAQSQLSYLIGADPSQSITLQAPDLPPLNQAVDLSQGIKVAEQRRPELQQASRNVFVAGRLVKLAHDTTSPTLGIVGVAQYDNVASAFSPQRLAYISAQLGIPLSDGGATRSRVRAAQLALQTEEVTRSSLQLSVSLEVRQAALNVANAQVRESSAQVAVKQANEAVRLANVRYQNGLGTFLDVTNALAQLATARNNLSQANYFYEVSLAQLVRNEGGR